MDESNSQSSSDKEGVSEDAVNYRDVEYLDVNSASDLHSGTASDRQPSFEDLSDGPSSENVTKNPLFLHGLNVPQQDSADSNLSEQSLHRGDAPTELNITVNLSAKEFKQFAFHFIGVFYVRFFKTQRLADPVQTSDIFGNTVEELLKCMWQKSCPYVSREVVVNYTEDANSVAWSTKENPDFSDVNKFIVLRHQKTKKLYSVEDLRDGSKVLTSWRGKSIQVHVYKYSTSLKSNTIWELTNKSLLQPGNKDRAGAPTTEELFDCISELKEVHCHYTALYSSWEKWANFILSQPGDRQSRLKHEAPPDEYLHLFRAPPISEGNQLQVTRRGFHIAFGICESVTSDVNQLCNVVDELTKKVSKVQLLAHDLKTKIDTSRSLLEAMQSSMPPEESEFSKKLASAVGDMVDVDHQE